MSVLVLPLLVAGCGKASDDAATNPPPKDAARTGGHGLVLRATTVGGIAGLGGKGTLPDVSVYGDGRAIARDGRAVTEYRLKPEALRRLVAGAEDAGLATPRTDNDKNVSDAMYTQLTFVTGGTPRTSRISRQGSGGAAAAFAGRLTPKTWPKGDLSAAAKPYEPEAVTALAVASPASGTVKKWPFAKLGGKAVGTRSCTLLTGGDAAEAGRLDPDASWRDHGTTYRVTFRPLLPDERDCSSIS